MTNPQATIERDVSSLLDELGNAERVQREAQEMLERAAAMQQANRARALELIVRLASRVGLTAGEVAKTIEAEAKSRASKPTAKKPAKSSVASGEPDTRDADGGTEGGSASAPNKSRGGVVVTNPADPSMTWAGRGRRPPWVTDELVAQAHGQMQAAQG